MGLYSQGTEAEGGIFSDLFGGHDNVENMWVYTPKGLRTAERGVFSDLSGGHECKEYMSLYSQWAEGCRKGSIF